MESINKTARIPVEFFFQTAAIKKYPFIPINSYHWNTFNGHLCCILIVDTIFFLQVICDESGKNLSSIPTNLLQNVTKLNLKNNKITLKHNDKNILIRLPNLTELYLNENMITLLYNNSFYSLTKLVILDISNNYINTVDQAAFAGLYQLIVLNLSYNRITQLDSDIFSSLKNLRVLNLQNNLLESFHIKPSFKLTTITLNGNPWNCSCSLLDLQIWLTASNVTMGKFS